ncbi:MAG: endonuclease/exonuclease/phosphatase family protein [Fuerstia sp.]|nr:endonuclease/exonuclease/phosphatase family protein [Fuerstiella sp.]
MNRYAFAVAMIFSGAFVECAPVLAQDDGSPGLRVMSFNIRYGTASDGKDVWTNRQKLVVTVIKTFAPDLMGTQETLPFQAKYINEQLPEYTYIGWSRDEGKAGEQCGIFVRTERFTITESGQFWLSETPDEKFSKSWDSSLPRVVTWTRLKDKQSADREFLFANTHFDHRGTEARKQSAILLRRRLSEMAPKLPIIVTGDFNCDQGSQPYQELLGEKVLADSFRVLHPTREDNEGTFHGFSGTPGAERIDWILATEQFKATEATIDRTNADGRYPSDHFPISAVFEWQK